MYDSSLISCVRYMDSANTKRIIGIPVIQILMCSMFAFPGRYAGLRLQRTGSLLQRQRWPYERQRLEQDARSGLWEEPLWATGINFLFHLCISFNVSKWLIQITKKNRIKFIGVIQLFKSNDSSKHFKCCLICLSIIQKEY